MYRNCVRVLAAIRQSKRKDLSESPATQLAAIRQWCEANGHALVDQAVDVGVSAKVSPFRRADLGPWLTDPDRLAQWDIVAGWKVDRLVRSLAHFYGELVPEIVDRLGKNAVSVTEGINTASSSAMEIAMRVSMAQEELTKMRDRATASRQGLRRTGRWAGGPAYFGYVSEKTPTGYKLAPDPDAAAALDRVVDMVLSGHNLDQCVEWLNDEKVMTAWDRNAVRLGRTPKGRVWRRRTLWQMLRSPHLLGYGVYRGEVVRDDDNQPHQFGPPIVDRARWDRLQVALGTDTRPWVRRSNGAMLRDVAHCAVCGRKMYHRPERPSDRRRYVCASTSAPAGTRDCFAASWLADDLEDLVAEYFLDVYGDREIVVRRAVRADDPSVRLSEIEDSLAALETDRYVKGRFKGREDRFDRMVSALEAERSDLAAKAAAGGIEVEHTGVTYREEWERREPNARGDLLREHGVVVMVQAPTAYRASFFDLYVPTP